MRNGLQSKKPLAQAMNQPEIGQTTLWPVLAGLRIALPHQPLTSGHCVVCGQPIESARNKHGGKPKLYCRYACKQKAVRERAKERQQRALSCRRISAHLAALMRLQLLLHGLR